MALLRVFHIVGGVFWVGTTWYTMLFLLPRMKALGPEGGRLMQRFAAPPLPAAMTASALSVGISGVLMFWAVSGHFHPGWLGTGTGIVLTIGSLAGISAVMEGFFSSRQASERLAAVGRQIASAGGPPDPALAAEAQALAAKLERGVYRTGYMMVVAVLAMATARYL